MNLSVLLHDLSNKFYFLYIVFIVIVPKNPSYNTYFTIDKNSGDKKFSDVEILYIYIHVCH